MAKISTKVLQPPKMEGGYSFASMQEGAWTAIMADDWVCPDGVPIAGIRWWGSYWNPPSPGNFTPYSSYQNNALPGVEKFTINIYENEAGSGSMPFDHPSPILLASWDFSVGSFTETKIDTVSSPVETDIYEYSVLLSNHDLNPTHGSPVTFDQKEGSTYWLSIVTTMSPNSPDRQWGWRESTVHNGSYAVQAIPLVAGTLTPWYIPCGGHDMSFELLPVPEPGSLLVLASGLIGLVGAVTRSRQR